MQDANWDRIEVVTSAPDEESLNPVIPALRAKLSAGELPTTTVNIHTVSSTLRDATCLEAGKRRLDASKSISTSNTQFFFHNSFNTEQTFNEDKPRGGP